MFKTSNVQSKAWIIFSKLKILFSKKARAFWNLNLWSLFKARYQHPSSLTPATEILISIYLKRVKFTRRNYFRYKIILKSKRAKSAKILKWVKKIVVPNSYQLFSCESIISSVLTKSFDFLLETSSFDPLVLECLEPCNSSRYLSCACLIFDASWPVLVLSFCHNSIFIFSGACVVPSKTHLFKL